MICDNRNQHSPLYIHLFIHSQSPQTRRASSLATPSSKLNDNNDDADFPQMDQDDEQEPMDMAAVPFDDDDDEQQPQIDDQPQDVSGLLDPSSVVQNDTSGVSIGGLVDDESSLLSSSNNNNNNNNNRRPAPTPIRQRPRKRRKVVIDNDATELSNDHIKSMIAHTNDLRMASSHPADWNPLIGASTTATTTSRPPPLPSNNHLWRPFLAQHNDACHPALIDLWDHSYYQVLERPCPFVRQPTQSTQSQQQQQTQEDDGSIEETRRQQSEDEEQSIEVPVMDNEEDVEFPPLDQEPQDVGDTVFDDDLIDDEEPPPQDEDIDHPDASLDFATDMADMQSTYFYSIMLYIIWE